MFENIIEIIGRLDALKKTAKLYHWNCNGVNFESDHLLFDKIADDLDDYIDLLSETYMMALKPSNIMEEEYEILIHNKDEYFGMKLSSNDEMAIELRRLIVDLHNKISETDSTVRGVENVLDDISMNLIQKIGFLNKRIGEK